MPINQKNWKERRQR